jgi:hypothetical protein
MPKNVMIPLPLLRRVIGLLECWDVSNYDPVVQLEHYDVLRSLMLKRRRLDLRDDYARIIRSKNESDRDDARIAYIQNRNWLRDDERGLSF